MLETAIQIDIQCALNRGPDAQRKVQVLEVKAEKTKKTEN